MTAAALRKTDVEHSAPARDQIIGRYRHLREISKRHHSDVLKFLSKDWLLHNGRRIGLLQDNTFLLDSEDDLNLVFDLAIYTSRQGRSRAVDRYAKAAKLPSETDEFLVLAAMQQAQFALIRVERRHEIAGLIVHDALRQRDIWLVDEGMEASMPDGFMLATRLFAPEQFSMTAGVLVPFDWELLADVMIDVPQLGRKKLAEVVDDRRFAESIYRLALEAGVLEGIGYRDPSNVTE